MGRKAEDGGQQRRDDEGGHRIDPPDGSHRSFAVDTDRMAGYFHRDG
jgi:hypothetical protein